MSGPFTFLLPAGVPVGAAELLTQSGSVETTDATLDHVAAALDRLPWQFEDQPNIVAVLTALITPMQTLENAIAQIILQRSVLIATGVTLTMLGDLVGQFRNGISDDTIYRRYVTAKIAANRSTGTPEDLIRVSRLVLNDLTLSVTYRREGTATARVTIASGAITQDTATALNSMLSASMLAGGRLVLEWLPSASAATFRLDSGPGFDTGHLAGSLDNGV